MQVTTFKTVSLHNQLPLSVGVDYKPINHINIFNTTANDNRKVTAMLLSPDFAHLLIKTLQEQLEWYKNPLYQWAKKKTDINKQIKFKR